MDIYYPDIYNDTEFQRSGVDRLSKKEQQLLHIRTHIDSLLVSGDFNGVDGVIRGVLYSNNYLCVEMICWQNFLNKGCFTLLHDILVKPQAGCDPPVSLIRMVLDIAPQVLFVPDVADYSPLHIAVYTKLNRKAPHGIRRNLDIIKLLVDADTDKKTLNAEIMEAIVWRGDEDVARYLLGFKESQSALLKGDSKVVVPLYHASKHYPEKDGTISNFMKVFLEATAKELKRQERTVGYNKGSFCCVYEAIDTCSSYVYDEDQLKAMARRDQLCCREHAC